ncbi:MAG: DUF86 domain-containing protein [Saprospiraceae bacterium]|nr:DUF86 domain-containing protein [Saprospiraceae bacterium]MCB9311127.1 DUF86 domain-containing protein [Lewinellaceae bacterium]HRW74405.1 DUF86 domain-containing protein [Saprospiraceae bacterium]
MSEKDTGNLAAILESCAKIKKFTADIWDADALFADEKTFDAVLMNFVIIGESVTRLSDRLKENEPQVPWDKIKGFRNIVAHDYFGVDAEEVWQLIKNNLPGLETEIVRILQAG